MCNVLVVVAVYRVAIFTCESGLRRYVPLPLFECVNRRCLLRFGKFQSSIPLFFCSQNASFEEKRLGLRNLANVFCNLRKFLGKWKECFMKRNEKIGVDIPGRYPVTNSNPVTNRQIVLDQQTGWTVCLEKDSML